MNAFLYTLKGDIHVGPDGNLCHAHNTVRDSVRGWACGTLRHGAVRNDVLLFTAALASLAQVTLTKEDGQGGVVVENKSDEPAEFVLIAGMLCYGGEKPWPVGRQQRSPVECPLSGVSHHTRRALCRHSHWRAGGAARALCHEHPRRDYEDVYGLPDGVSGGVTRGVCPNGMLLTHPSHLYVPRGHSSNGFERAPSFQSEIGKPLMH